jgi:hypothetical protein
MKVRLGFITNSSSTNHIMMWKGSQYDLKKFLMENLSVFPTESDGYNQKYVVEKGEILDAILSMINNAMNKEAIKEELQNRLERAERWYEEEKERKDSWSVDWEKEELEFAKKLLNSAEDKDWMLEVSFGDNEGDFAGGNIGNIMDYEGRLININEDGFSYTTEQNR